MPGKIAELWVEIGAKFENLNKAFSDVEKASQKFGNRLESIGKQLTMKVTLPLLAIAGVSIKVAMDTVKTERIFSASMGKMADAGRAWGKQMEESFGLSEHDAREMMATLNIMLKQMGQGEKQSYEMSKGLTELSYNMAAFYGIKPEEAFEKIKSSIMGFTRPLKLLGIAIDDNSVKQWAFKNGLIKQNEEMSTGQEVVARYNVIMEKTGHVHGYVGKTMDTANAKQRILKEQMEDISRTMGTELLPLYKKLLDFGISIARTFSAMDSTTVGITMAYAGLAAALGPLLFLFGKLLKLMPLLNAAIWGSRTAFIASAGGAAILVDALIALLYGYSKVKMAQEELRKAEQRADETQKSLSAKLAEAAKLAGLSSIEFLKLRDKYAALYGTLEYGTAAMAMAIAKGKEGKELQEALAKVSAKHKKAIDDQKVSLEGLTDEFKNYFKNLGITKEEEKTWIDYLHDKGLMTLEEQWKKLADVKKYLIDVNKAYRDGKIDLFDYIELVKQLNEEIKKLSTKLELTPLPPPGPKTGIIPETPGKMETPPFTGPLQETWQSKLARFVEDSKESFKKIYEWGSYFIGELDSLFGRFYENQMLRLDNEYSARKRAIEGSLMSEEAKSAALEKLDSEFERRRIAIMRKEAVAAKLMAVFEIALNIAVAISNAVKTLQFWLIPIVAGLGAAQLATVIATPLPSFKEGGYLSKPAIIEAGHGPKGEIVAQPSQLARIIAEEFPKFFKTGLTPAPIFNITFNMKPIDSYDTQRFIREKAIPEIIEALKSKMKLYEFREALGVKT